MLLRIVALIGVLLTGVVSHAGSSRYSIHPSATAADLRVLSTASVALKPEPRSQVLAWLARQRAVRWVRIASDGQTLDVHFRDGRMAAILPPTFGTVNLPAAAHLAVPLFHPAVRLQASPSHRALVLEPVDTELGLGPNAGDPEASRLKAAGFSVDSLYDTQVTVNSMAGISGYNVVYMHTHSYSSSPNDAIIGTGQLSSDSSGLGPFLQDGSVIQCLYSGSTALYYCITSTYIEKHMGQFPAHSIVFLNGCKLLNATRFWNALQDKGVGVMVTWDNEASSRDNYLGAAAFFAEMAQGTTVSEAIAAEQAAGYGKSQVNGQEAKIGFQGDGGITLGEAGNASIPPQTTPAVGATPIPGTTPPLVGTVNPAPLLTATLRSHVAPGKRQAISILSAPRTVVNVAITFPDGQDRVGSVTTDSSGRAVYIFPQPASRVTFGHVFAQVVLQAGAAPQQTTFKLRYRILWGKIDVSVLPRTQSVGRIVRVWVHSRAHRKVVVTLHFPRGKVKTLHGRTDSSGWVGIPYRVAPGHSQPNDTVVLVQAKVRLPKGVFHAGSTFSIH